MRGRACQRAARESAPGAALQLFQLLVALCLRTVRWIAQAGYSIWVVMQSIRLLAGGRVHAELTDTRMVAVLVAAGWLLLLVDAGPATGSLPTRAVGNQQGPAANQQPPGDWRCCWNLDSCAAASAATCPASPEPPLTACATDFAACTGPCSRPGNRTLWCQTDATGCDDSNPPKCVAPPSTFDDPTLRQKFRPPQQTPLQAEAMAEVAATAL